jgi:lipopolysaccharide export system permease protein
VFGSSLAAITFIMIVVGLINEAVRQNLSLGPVFRLIPYLLPNALSFAIPATILLTVCIVYGRMSAANEITALKSGGVSPWKIILPAVWLGFALSLLSVWLNDVAFSWGYAGVQRVVIESIEEIAYSTLKAKRNFSDRRFSIVVKRVEGRKLIQPVITFNAVGGAPAVTLVAQEAELKSDFDENKLTIELTNGTVEVGKDVVFVFTDTIRRDVPLADAQHTEAVLGPGHLSQRRIRSELPKQEAKIEEIEQQMAAEAALELLTGNFAALAEPRWQHQRQTLHAAQYRLNRLRTEPWRRLSNGFSCLCFALVGVPLAIRIKSADVVTSFWCCFVPILLVYYPLMAYGVDRAKAGAVPPYMVLLGNAVCVVIGAWQLKRVMRY